MLIRKINLLSYGLISLISLIIVLTFNISASSQLVVVSPSEYLNITSDQLIWPTQGLISQGFHEYKHEGIDIAGSAGTPIFAAASGVVVKAGWDNWGLGNAIEIKHFDQSVTVYGHNRRLLVTLGQQVTQGEIIAQMGSTGNSSGPHLHFEFYPNGRVAADPMKLLASVTTKQQVLPPQAPTRVTTQCSGMTILEGETTSNLIKICQENAELFYIGQLKANSTTPIKIPAWNIGKDKYRADNGTFTYLVNPSSIEVWRNGVQIRTDMFSAANSWEN
ncbi:M23 family metallopeptidase [Nodularia harveyana UHCC-0300]|uniref:M23 family metallopeptidase n=1 Tax=Nodularia harveyana UHCC-0300 TaxID=2974287 RepID=A0ABU5UC83_9CYAN|nr:M23 family metallopeptidase [Nodularia harveyana]MEA5581138.1 M23 family metallopeptidase [Nodularia harveyana UHCC-0300]